MAKFQPWLKMWVEWLDDLKMLDLTLAEQGAWWRLVTLAKKCAAAGALVKDNGAPLSLNEIADTLRITSKPDRKALDAMIQKMAGQGSLHWNSNALVVTHFAERQAKTSSATPEAVRDRVRRFREKKADVTEKALQESLAEEIRERLVTVPLTESYREEHEVIKKEIAELGKLKGYISREELTTSEGRIDLCWLDQNSGKVSYAFEVDALLPKYKSLLKLRSLEATAFIILRRNTKPFQWEQDILLIGLGRPRLKDEPEVTPTPPQDIESEAEADNSLHFPLHVTEKSLQLSLALAKITKLYEQYFGIITPVLAEKFKDFVENYHGPVDWIDLAFAEALKYKNRRWQYVEAILYSWQEKGGPHADRGERGGGGEQPGADQRDIIAEARGAGWEVLGEEEPEAGNKD